MFAKSSLVLVVFLVYYFVIAGPLSMVLGKNAGHIKDTKGLSPWCTDKAHRGYNNVHPECCIDQYNCNWYIEPKNTRDGLTNNDLFTRRSCQCDEDFYDCNTERRIFFEVSLIKWMTFRELCAQNNSETKQVEWVGKGTWLRYYV